MVLGALVGALMGESHQTTVFAPLGTLFIQLIKMLVIPLVAVAILSWGRQPDGPARCWQDWRHHARLLPRHLRTGGVPGAGDGSGVQTRCGR